MGVLVDYYSNFVYYLTSAMNNPQPGLHGALALPGFFLPWLRDSRCYKACGFPEAERCGRGEKHEIP